MRNAAPSAAERAVMAPMTTVGSMTTHQTGQRAWQETLVAHSRIVRRMRDAGNHVGNHFTAWRAMLSTMNHVTQARMDAISQCGEGVVPKVGVGPNRAW